MNEAKIQYQAFSLAQVSVTEPYCANALMKEKEYLLSLDERRLTAGFFETAGLEVLAARYGGWESTEIQGHTMGHYLTALAQLSAVEKSGIFKEKLEWVCSALERCQREDGYLFAQDEEIFDRIERHQPAWVPWYTMHKILSGLIAAAALGESKTAYRVAGRLGDWICRRVSSWTDEVRSLVLAVEYGGMNDALYSLYRLTGEERYLEAARQFDEEHLFDKLYANEDILNGLHANTTIPKINGALSRYLLTGEEYYLKAAENFWDMVVKSHTYITGGNSEWEHFGEPEVLDQERTACNCETCNTFNMLKITERLFQISGKRKYAEYYERTWLNAILASQNPKTGMTMYFQPMATGYFKVYQDPYTDFWCCTGTGMENFTKIQNAVYYHNEQEICIARYLSSRLEDVKRGLKLTMDVVFPEEKHVCIRIEKADGPQKIVLRNPAWSSENPALSVNHKYAKAECSNGFFSVVLNQGDVLEIDFDPQIKAHYLPDNENAVAFTYGPVALCAKLGGQAMDITTTGVQVKVPKMESYVRDYLILKDQTPEQWLGSLKTNISKEPGRMRFHLKGIEGGELEFTPYFKQHEERYGIYWYLFGKDSPELEKMKNRRAEEQKIAGQSVDRIPIGNDQYELAHEVHGEKTEAGRLSGINYRQAECGGYFTYRMKMKPDGCYLAVTFGKGETGNHIAIEVNSQLLVSEELTEQSDEFYTRFYWISPEILEGRDQAEVRFCAGGDGEICRIYKILYVTTEPEERRRKNRWES